MTIEIDSARATVQARAVPVHAIALVNRETPYLHYRLAVTTDLPYLRSEAPILLDLGEPAPRPLQVVEAAARELTVASTMELPSEIPSGARLLIDDVWLLERMREDFSKVRRRLSRGDPNQEFNADLAEHVVGRGDFQRNRVSVPAVPPAAILEPLNEEQQCAVGAALRQRATFLWGPPGTGKTTTLAAIVHAHVEQGRRVLVAAPSNVAADVLALAIANEVLLHPGFGEGLQLRVGPRPTAELRRRFGDKVIPQEVARRLARAGAAEHFDRLAREEENLKAAGVYGTEAQSRLANARYTLEREQQADEVQRLHELLERCGVLVTPVQQVYLSRQLRGKFDVVVLDEASMTSTAQLWLTVGKLAREQVVVAGDFMQLPAPVIHRRNAEVPWLATDPFTTVGIPDDIEREDDPPYVVALREQYRMAPAIGDLVSDTFYRGRLRTAPEVARRRTRPWVPGIGSIVLVDTTMAAPRAVLPPGSGSRENPIHIEIVSRLISSLTDGGAGADPGRVLVLSPYARQAERLREMLRGSRASARPRPRAATVHAAQGSEAETVVVTLDDAPGAPASQFMAARGPRDTGGRLLNVALSRARDRVIVLAPVDFLFNTAGPVVRSVLVQLQERGQVLRPDDF